MNLSERIRVLIQLGDFIRQEADHELLAVIDQAIINNPWFTKESIGFALKETANKYLSEVALTSLAKSYKIKNRPHKIGLVLAGNIPMVGIHDVICVFLAGHIAMIKYSSKDDVLIKYLLAQLIKMQPKATKYIIEVDRLKGMEAVIATGGSTAATHFAYYFSKYPHIIRKNRSSIAVLDGQESSEQLAALGADIFTYFGLGCRNVSKLYVPEEYKFDHFFESIIDYSYVINHNKYKNNFDYSNAIYLLGKQPFLTNNFLIIREDDLLSSRISCVHYEYYQDINVAIEQIKSQEESIQCVASISPLDGLQHIMLGDCQSPGIDDFADDVDTMSFLTGLYD